MKSNDSYKVNIMSNNKISPRLAAGFFGAHYHPKTAYKDLAPNVVGVSPKQEDTTNITEKKPPVVPKLREAVMKSLMEASLQPQNPLAIFAKD
ncbi:Uncharacterised protein [Legionella donaldsonii]|uniref:Uncharacterized protein n=2 Tax=Legionella donaldsonii TaxID=45060 RepID=A0A378J9H9_9GAMM|nr:Uncharacterised protein [Legionella donaldsonii]